MNRSLFVLLKHLKMSENKSNIDMLAKKTHTSIMQLQRDFYNLTGYSANEYMRRLQLSKALCLIKSSKSTLSDIAYSCGYSSQQALCREIKSILNTTATNYRKSNDYYFLSEPNQDTPFQIEVSRKVIPKTVCLKYYSQKLSNIENRAVQLFLRNNSDYSGRIFGRNGDQTNNTFSYELYVENTPGLNMDKFDFAGYFTGYDAFFAQTRVVNNPDIINAAWNFMYSTWLPCSMFVYAANIDDIFQNKYFEEFYLMKSYPRRLKLYLPIVRRHNLLKITIETGLSMYFLCSSQKGLAAENRASQAVINFLQYHYPHIILNTNEFYFQQADGCTTCGVRVPAGLSINNLNLKTYKNQTFAILRISGLGDYCQFRQILLQWLLENKFTASGEPFAVYDTSQSFEEPQTRLYCPIQTLLGYDNTIDNV